MTEKISTINWRPIDTAPRVEFASYLGYDSQAESWDAPEDGLCLITWLDKDEETPAGWEVTPLNDINSVVYDERTNITLWAPLWELLPK